MRKLTLIAIISLLAAACVRNDVPVAYPFDPPISSIHPRGGV